MLLTGVDETTNLVKEVIVTSEGAIRTMNHSGRYEDMGAVIDAAGVAVGAGVYTDYLDNVPWIRYIVMLVDASQNWDMGCVRRTASGVASAAAAWLSSQPATGDGARQLVYGPQSGELTNAVLGYSAKFYLKNVGASPADLTMYLQAIGG